MKRTNNQNGRTNKTVITGNTINISGGNFFNNPIIETPLNNLNKWDLKRLYRNNEKVRKQTKIEHDTQEAESYKNELYSLITDTINEIKRSIKNGDTFKCSNVSDFSNSNKDEAKKMFVCAIYASFTSVFNKEGDTDLSQYFAENVNNIFDAHNTRITSNYEIYVPFN